MCYIIKCVRDELCYVFYLYYFIPASQHCLLGWSNRFSEGALLIMWLVCSTFTPWNFLPSLLFFVFISRIFFEFHVNSFTYFIYFEYFSNAYIWILNSTWRVVIQMPWVYVHCCIALHNDPWQRERNNCKVEINVFKGEKLEIRMHLEGHKKLIVPRVDCWVRWEKM